MSHPKVKIKLKQIDWLFEILALIGLVVLFVLPLMYYDTLPDQIPRHFNASGEPDGFGGKSVVWFLPVIGAFMYALFTGIAFIPHHFNYPVEITEANAAEEYRNGTKLIRVLKAIITASFAYITYGTIKIALGESQGLGKYFLVTFILLILGVVVYFISRSLNKKK